MDDEESFRKPPQKLLEKLPFSPHFLTPAGMLLPQHQQPPPMYGPRGATVPPKFIPKYENIASQPSFRGRGRGRPQTGPRKPFNHNEKVLMPRNWELWCETCDRDLKTKELLEVHLSEHKTCGIDGCKFVGHPMILENHVVQQHESGLFDKLKNLESPEDISKWRAERRKNYPTRANIELKEKVKAAKKERGEKLEVPNQKFNKNVQQKTTKRQKKNQRRKEKQLLAKETQKEPAAAVRTFKEVPSSRVGFRGTRGMWDDEPPKANPLLGLIGMYGSGSEESDNEEEMEEDATVNVKPEAVAGQPEEPLPTPSTEPECEGSSAAVNINSDSVENELADDNTSAAVISTEMMPGDPSVNSSSPSSAVEAEEQQTVNKQIRKPGKRKLDERHELQNKIVPKERKVIKSGLNYEALKRTKPNTLLFKLLQDEIRHERNVLLQAVKFVVENRFFDEQK